MVKQKECTILRPLPQATEGRKMDVMFSLVDALDEGYFSDLKVHSSGGAEVSVPS